MIEQELRRIIRQIVREELEVDSARELITELAEELLPGIVAESLEGIRNNRDVIPQCQLLTKHQGCKERFIGIEDTLYLRRTGPLFATNLLKRGTASTVPQTPNTTTYVKANNVIGSHTDGKKIHENKQNPKPERRRKLRPVNRQMKGWRNVATIDLFNRSNLPRTS